MNNDLNLAAVTLPRSAVHRLAEARGLLVSCLSGSLWLTQEGDRRDIVLEAGDDALVEHDGLTLLAALSDARFVLAAPPPLSAARAMQWPPVPLALLAMN
jgi:redox-sensitive bicupin YhaK (pirin superfamily)